MKSIHISGLMFGLMILFVLPAQAGELPRYSAGADVIHGGSPNLAKAGGDTINLMAASDDPTNNVDPRDGGLEPYYDGDFEDAVGNPDWNGWIHYDITAPTTSHWNVSTYNQPDPSNHAAWCGDIDIPSCEGGDPDGGYGNSWNDLLEFRQAVPYPELGSTVSVYASMIHDTELGYDYIYLSYLYEGQNFANMQMWDGAGTVAVSNSVSYLPTEYIGGTEIAVYFRFWSDGMWSDEDCSFPSAGACQIDDIDVHIVNGAFDGTFFEDFEHGGDPDDFGIWTPLIPDGVGDFAHIWTGLEDYDPCATNYTPQVAFIDDGIVVPGTGGSECINWCYGPGGYIVTTTGGLAGPDYHIHNAIESPVMDWPASKTGNPVDDDGITLTFSVYRHEDLSADSPGIFYVWGVRSADTDGSAGTVQDITNMGWQNRNYVYYGGPDYLRAGDDVTDLMNPGRDVVQVQLAVYEIGYVWGWVQNDGTPAPYFDNVTVKIFPYDGPGMSAREIDLAQDNFPERGTIDMGDPGSHSVRFDMANNISLAAHLRNDPGDSITVDITPVRAGADFDGFPTLHYILDRNPVFDDYRTAGLPDMGSAVGDSAVGPSGSPTPGKWAFDLPDTGFLFPGDVLHYYISATDAIGGTAPQTALMPADTTGFSAGFGDPMQYAPAFTVRALPSIREKYAGYEQPEVLFINDFASRGGEDEWYTSLYNCGLQVGRTYDVFHVNGPSSGVGNGIGGRANHLMLADYSVILYTCGDLGVNTISNGDFNLDAGDDVGTLINWLDIGDKKIFLTGDNLASDLAGSSIATRGFLENYMGLSIVASNVRPLISNQTTPYVNTIFPQEVFNATSSWIAYGGCPGINAFDGVQTRGTASRLAEFTGPSGERGIYPYSTATLNWVDTSRVISMPVDFSFIHSDRNNPSPGWLPFPDRTLILWDVLTYFGIPLIPTDTPVEMPRITFQVSNYPNPFNPGTTIRYAMPRAGNLKLSVYNVRGHLVKTLIDGPRPAGENQTIFWDGSDNLGSAAASGVYFYEARAAGEVKIGKMTLLK
jgi:hypothetical protein